MPPRKLMNSSNENASAYLENRALMLLLVVALYSMAQSMR